MKSLYPRPKNLSFKFKFEKSTIRKILPSIDVYLNKNNKMRAYVYPDMCIYYSLDLVI